MNLRNISIAALMILSACLCPTIEAASTAGNQDGVKVTQSSLTRRADKMNVNIMMDLSGVKVSRNEIAVITPVLVNGSNEVEMPSISIYGRTRWYQYLRAGEKPVGNAQGKVYRYPAEDVAVVQEYLPYQDWMNGSQLVVRRTDYGCCGKELANGTVTVPTGTSYVRTAFVPEFIYAEATEADLSKVHDLSGRAYVDFVVNRTEINPDYKNNARELKKITTTIDSVREDPDITVTSIEIKGYASPDGPYANNVRLAKGRTEALSDYVQKLYNFPNGVIKTSYEPVDWQGLKDYLETSGLEHRNQIIAVIDNDEILPADKNPKIKSSWPKDYNFLLQNVYPGLRHSDYRIEYEIRTYTTVKEIEELIFTQPYKLSLDEMFFLAKHYEEGGEMYNRIYEAAVKMYPDSEVANINAANSAMQSGNLEAAENYLAKAGNGGEAFFARGMLAALKGDYRTAISLIKVAETLGVDGSTQMIEHIKEVIM